MTNFQKTHWKTKALFILQFSFLIGCMQQSQNSIVARVNKQEIQLKDLHKRLTEYQFDSTLNTPEKNFELKKNVLNEIIQESIVSQLAIEKKLFADPTEVERVLGMTYSSEELESPANKNKIRDIKQRITQQILAINLYTWVTANVGAPKEKEVKAYYDAHPQDFVQEEQIRIQQIIVKTKPEAQSILAELKDNKPFEMLVKKYSILPESTLVGDTGFVGRGMFDEKLETAIYKIKEGSVGPIVETNNGFHIVKVLGKKQSKILEFSDVRDFIYANMLQEKKETLYNKWLEQKILQTNIERNHAILQQNIPIS